ncbi:MAG: extracellular solute-binding protein [Bacillota bacterium]|nr:extracellular solute-binding protein [Bacillota bacterium]
MKKVMICLVLVTLLLGWNVSSENEEAIIIYSSAEQFRNDEMQKQLNEKFPELNIYVMYMPTAKAAAKIAAEGKDTDADIVVALESAYMEKIEENLENISGMSRLEYLDDARTASDKYVVWERQAGSIIVNNTVLKKHNLPVPKTYEDLLNPIYKNMIAMPDPKSSGTGYFFYKNLINVMGEEQALEYIDKLAFNVKQFTESGSGPVKLLIQQEVAIGLGLTFQAVSEKNEGNDFSIIQPEYGSPYSLTGTGLVKGRKENEDILKVFDFLINDFLIYDKEYFSPEKILKQQENRIPEYPKDIVYADMTGIEDMQEKERLLSLWKY